MVEKKQIQKKKYEYDYKQKHIGKDMIDLIEYVGESFEEQYGLKPTIIDITNLIARRVKENNLF